MEHERRAQRYGAAAIRRGDHRPYSSVRWVSILFKAASVFLSVAVLAEFIAGIRAEGWSVLPFVLGEAARASVLVILLWACGDLIRLVLQVSKDLRAQRVLLARIAHRTPPVEDAARASASDELLVEVASSGAALSDGELSGPMPSGGGFSGGAIPGGSVTGQRNSSAEVLGAGIPSAEAPSGAPPGEGHSNEELSSQEISNQKLSDQVFSDQEFSEQGLSDQDFSGGVRDDVASPNGIPPSWGRGELANDGEGEGGRPGEAAA